LEAGSCLVLHDTTRFDFPGDVMREGLGPFPDGKQGFLGHFALAVSQEATPRPLGVLGFYAVFREQRRKRVQGKSEAREDTTKEFHRWADLSHDTSSYLLPLRPIHVMDEEADAYELLARMVDRHQRFVVRTSDRVCFTPDGAKSKVSAQSVAAPIGFVRQVHLHERRPNESSKRTSRSRPLARKARYPSRHAREAKLACSATRITLKRTPYASRSCAKSLELNVVVIRELDAPQDCEPIHWTLVTNEPVSSQEELESVVDAYRARWLIEEYFKALKTGCAYQSRQLETRTSLLNALAIFSVFAWQLLLLRTLARSNASANEVLTPLQLSILRAVSKKPLPPNPTAEEALLAIAARGGHIKNNGPPGWLVLWRGLEKLLNYEVGYLLAANGS
jgi:hypothetical protein